MVSVNLTSGVIERIMRAHIDQNEPPTDPIVQCCSRKFLNANGPQGEPRYRMGLSDGTHKWEVCTTSTQSGNRVHNGELTENDVFKMTKYLTQTQPSNGKIVIVLVDFEKLANVALIGCPTIWGAEVGPTAIAPSHNTNKGGGGNTMGSGGGDGVHPIVGLTPYQNKWKICARVGQRGDVKNYNNQKGPGKLFSCDLIDSSGEIRATAFNTECDRLYNVLTPGGVFYISGGRVKAANKKFSTINNDYELTFDKSTEVVPCNENGGQDIPTFCFNFTKICNVVNCVENDVVDVIGVVKSMQDVTSITTKTGKQLDMRRIVLVDNKPPDNSPCEVELTLWDLKAQEVTGHEGSILALKGIRVNEYMGGKSLSANHGTQIHFNPDIPVAAELRLWYDQSGHLLDSTLSLSANRSGAGGSKSFVPIEAAETAYQPTGDDVKEYLTVKACVTFLKADTCLYQACKKDGCKKKVVDNNDGTYSCVKCNEQFDSFKYCLMLSACISDWSGQKWVTMFSEVAETLLGVTTEQLGQLKDSDNDAFLRVFAEATHKPFVFRIVARLDNYNDEQRMRWNVNSITPVNVDDYEQFLNKHIQLWA